MKKNRICLKIVRHKLKRYRKKHPFIFYFLTLYLGVLFIYAAIFHIGFADYSKAMPLNEIGDFLAGVFAPIAFLFLYLGYRQQGEEMKQNTAALKLQAQELKYSVDEQRRLIQLHEKEQEEKHFQVLPDFKKYKQKVRRYKQPLPLEDEEGNIYETIDEEILEVSFTLKNYGELAKNVLVKSIEKEFYVRVNKYKIYHEEELEISLELNGQIIQKLEEGEEYDHVLILTYTNIYGKAYTKFLDYNVCSYPDPESCIINFGASLYMR